MARLAGAVRSGLGDGLRAVLAGAKGIGGRDAAHRGSNRAAGMCRGVEVEVRRRCARRSSGTGAAAVRAEGSGSGKIQASRRSRCAARQGLRCGGKAWPRRRGLCSDRSNRGGGARVLGKDWGGDRSREVAEPVIGGGRDLDVRAVGHAGECHGEISGELLLRGRDGRGR